MLTPRAQLLVENPGAWSAEEALSVLRRGARDPSVIDDPDHRRVVAWIRRNEPNRSPAIPDAGAVYRSVLLGGRGEEAFLSGDDALRRFGYGPLSRFASSRARRTFLGLGSPWSPGLPGPGERVADLGCGSGVDLSIAAASVMPGGEVWGVDRRSTLLPQPPPANATLSVTPADRSPIPDSWADLVVANGLPPLLSAAEAPPVLREVSRILAPGGRLRAVVLAADCRGRGDDESLVAARRSGKPLLRELTACLSAAGLTLEGEDLLPSPYRDHVSPEGVDAALLSASRPQGG